MTSFEGMYLSAATALALSSLTALPAISDERETNVPFKFIGEIQRISDATVGADPCFIHSGCNKGVGYSKTGSMGRGWYCKDGKLVKAGDQFDDCIIEPGCTAKSRNVQYGPVWKSQEHELPRVVGRRWQCYDNAFIHKQCAKGVVYMKDGTMGDAWYCNDGKKVESNTPIDTSYIEPGCKYGVVFDKSLDAWKCNS